MIGSGDLRPRRAALRGIRFPFLRGERGTNGAKEALLVVG